MLKELPFFGKEHEDACEHIEEVVEISNYFHAPNISKDAVILWLLPFTLKGEAKEWLKSLPFGAITTWADFKTDFINQFTLLQKWWSLKKKDTYFSTIRRGVVIRSLGELQEIVTTFPSTWVQCIIRNLNILWWSQCVHSLTSRLSRAYDKEESNNKLIFDWWIS